MKMSLSSSFERLPIQLSPVATVMSTRWRFSCIMRSICSSKVSLVILHQPRYLVGVCLSEVPLWREGRVFRKQLHERHPYVGHLGEVDAAEFRVAFVGRRHASRRLVQVAYWRNGYGAFAVG